MLKKFEIEIVTTNRKRFSSFVFSENLDSVISKIKKYPQVALFRIREIKSVCDMEFKTDCSEPPNLWDKEW